MGNKHKRTHSTAQHTTATLLRWWKPISLVAVAVICVVYCVLAVLSHTERDLGWHKLSVHHTAGTSANENFVRHSVADGVNCVDGSAAVIYTHSTCNLNATNTPCHRSWVFHLGSFHTKDKQAKDLICSESECASRSSFNFPPQLPHSHSQQHRFLKEVLPSTPYVHVFVPYCTGDLFLSTPPQNSIQNHGFEVLRHVMSRFRSQMINATDVLFVGTGPGAVGLSANFDFIASFVPPLANMRTLVDPWIDDCIGFHDQQTSTAFAEWKQKLCGTAPQRHNHEYSACEFDFRESLVEVALKSNVLLFAPQNTNSDCDAQQSSKDWAIEIATQISKHKPTSRSVVFSPRCALSSHSPTADQASTEANDLTNSLLTHHDLELAVAIFFTSDLAFSAIGRVAPSTGIVHVDDKLTPTQLSDAPNAVLVFGDDAAKRGEFVVWIEGADSECMVPCGLADNGIAPLKAHKPSDQDWVAQTAVSLAVNVNLDEHSQLQTVAGEWTRLQVLSALADRSVRHNLFHIALQSTSDTQSDAVSFGWPQSSQQRTNSSTDSPQHVCLAFSSTNTGTFRVRVSFHGIEIGQPFALVVEPGPMNPAKSLVHGIYSAQTLPARAGWSPCGQETAVHNIMIHARDSWGNHIAIGGENVVALYDGPTASGGITVDHQNGSYSAQATIQCSGSYGISVVLRSFRFRPPTHHIGNSPFVTQFTLFSQQHVDRDDDLFPTTCVNDCSKLRGNGYWTSATSHARVSKWALNRNTSSTLPASAEWFYDKCTPVHFSAQLTQLCLVDTWIYFVGEGVAKQMFAFLKKYLIQAKLEDSFYYSHVAYAVSPLAAMLLAEQSFADPVVNVHEQQETYENKFGAVITWLGGVSANTSSTEDPTDRTLSNLKWLHQQKTNSSLTPTVYFLSLSNYETCATTDSEFVQLVESAIEMSKQFEAAVVWLTPVAVFDENVGLGDGGCNWALANSRCKLLTKLLSDAHVGYIDLWQLSATRPDYLFEYDPSDSEILSSAAVKLLLNLVCGSHQAVFDFVQESAGFSKNPNEVARAVIAFAVFCAVVVFGGLKRLRGW